MVTLTYSLVGVFKKIRSGLFGLPVERKVRKESEVPTPPPLCHLNHTKELLIDYIPISFV